MLARLKIDDTGSSEVQVNDQCVFMFAEDTRYTGQDIGASWASIIFVRWRVVSRSSLFSNDVDDYFMLEQSHRPLVSILEPAAYTPCEWGSRLMGGTLAAEHVS